jgi:hypothetical protein
MTYIVTWARNYQNNLSDNFQDIWAENITSSMLTMFSIFGLCDLVFDPRWPIFELELEIIKTTFPTNFQDIYIKSIIDLT